MRVEIPPDELERVGTVIEFNRYGRCLHNHLLVNDELQQVTCKQCGEKLNPYFAIQKMMRLSDKWRKQKAEAELAVEELEKRKRTKCEKCGEMTDITTSVTLAMVQDRMRQGEVE